MPASGRAFGRFVLQSVFMMGVLVVAASAANAQSFVVRFYVENDSGRDAIEGTLAFSHLNGELLESFPVSWVPNGSTVYVDRLRIYPGQRFKVTFNSKVYGSSDEVIRYTGFYSYDDDKSVGFHLRSVDIFNTSRAELVLGQLIDVNGTNTKPIYAKPGDTVVLRMFVGPDPIESMQLLTDGTDTLGDATVFRGPNNPFVEFPQVSGSVKVRRHGVSLARLRVRYRSGVISEGRFIIDSERRPPDGIARLTRPVAALPSEPLPPSSRPRGVVRG
jgi:hypothetical protein